jgi:hypothetical protein
VPDPPSIAALTARIAADIKRRGYSLISYEELRAAWPHDFGTAGQVAMVSMIARTQNWTFSYQESGVCFAPGKRAV